MSEDTKPEGAPNVFTDEQNRQWPIKITVKTVRQCRAIGIDLGDIGNTESGLLSDLISNPELVADIAYIAVGKLADERGVSGDDFAELLLGDYLQNLFEVVLQALVDFTPDPRDRVTLQMILKKTKGAIDKVRDMVENRMKDGGEVDIAIQAELDKIKAEMEVPTIAQTVQRLSENKGKPKASTSSKSRTESQAESGSTQKATHSGS